MAPPVASGVNPNSPDSQIPQPHTAGPDLDHRGSTHKHQLHRLQHLNTSAHLGPTHLPSPEPRKQHPNPASQPSPHQPNPVRTPLNPSTTRHIPSRTEHMHAPPSPSESPPLSLRTAHPNSPIPRERPRRENLTEEITSLPLPRARPINGACRTLHTPDSTKAARRI